MFTKMVKLYHPFKLYSKYLLDKHTLMVAYLVSDIVVLDIVGLYCLDTMVSL